MASPTNWYPLHAQKRRKWLLTDGKTVLTDPVVEQSTSGRRVRVQGAAKSHSNTERDRLAYNDVLRQAAAKGERILCEYFGEAGNHPDFDRSLAQPKLHIINNPSNDKWTGGAETTKFGWHFRCVEIPQIDVVVEVRASDVRNYYGISKHGARRKIETILHTTRLLPTTAAYAEPGKPVEPPDESRDTGFRSVGGPTRDNEFHRWVNRPVREVEEEVGESLWVLSERDQEPLEFVNDDRGAIREILRRVRKWDEVEDFFIPNYAKALLRRADWPDVLTMRLVRTNATQEAIDDLVTVLDAGPAIDAALEHFTKMQTALRSIGLVLGDVRSADIIKVLAGQGQVSLLSRVETVKQTADDYIDEAADGREDIPITYSHDVHLDLLTGMFVINCSEATLDDKGVLNTAAAQWQEASAMASITGQEPELLAYARAYAKQRTEKNLGIIRKLTNR